MMLKRLASPRAGNVGATIAGYVITAALIGLGSIGLLITVGPMLSAILRVVPS